MVNVLGIGGEVAVSTSVRICSTFSVHEVQIFDGEPYGAQFSIKNLVLSKRKAL